MPICEVWYDPQALSDDHLKVLARVLPPELAQVLDVSTNPDARVQPEDMQIRFIPFGEFDVFTSQVQIIIHAAYFPERETAMPDRLKRSKRFLARVLHGLEFFVFVLFSPYGFVHHRPE